MKNVWQGVLIEESLISNSLLDHIKIIATRLARLEGEEDKGDFHFHNVEVSDDNLELVLDLAQKNLKPSWYFHLVKQDRMKVVYPGKIFEITKGSRESFKAARNYGISLGILSDQLDFEDLIHRPFD